jgi:predicted MFS family arabinose efflux permease
LPGLIASWLDLAPEDPAAYRIPLLLVTLLLVPALLAMLATREVRVQGAQAPATDAGPAPVALMLAVALAMALRMGGRSSVMAFFNVYLDDALGVSTALIGALTALGQLVSVPAALLAPPLVARWGNLRTHTWGTLAVAVLMLPLALVPTWTAAGMGYASSIFFFSMTISPIRVFSQELVRPHWRSAMAAAFMGGAGLAYSAVSYAGGHIIAAWGYQPLFLLGAAMIAAGALFFWAYFRVPRRDQAGVRDP